MIKIKNIKKYYSLGSVNVSALNTINLEIKKGDYICIYGPSGCGKTTLLNLIGGLDKPTEGTIIVDGKEISSMSSRKLTKYRREYVGFVFQRFYLIPNLTVVENLLFPMKYIEKDVSRKNHEKLAVRLLEYTGISHLSDRKPTEISGGEQQRVAIARSLIGSPDIILADEPTGEIDRKNTKKIVSLFKKINKRDDKTIIIASHDEYHKRRAKRSYELIDGEYHGYE